jgi:hypothetical protein
MARSPGYSRLGLRLPSCSWNNAFARLLGWTSVTWGGKTSLHPAVLRMEIRPRGRLCWLTLLYIFSVLQSNTDGGSEDVHKRLLPRPWEIIIFIMIDALYKSNIWDNVLHQNTLRIINYLDHILFEIKIEARRFGDKIGPVARQNSK